MAVQVDQEVYDGLERVRVSGDTNMLDRRAVQFFANQNNDYATVMWIEDNPREYSKGIFEGFEVTA